jgi:hypothetical protein
VQFCKARVDETEALATDAPETKILARFFAAASARFSEEPCQLLSLLPSIRAVIQDEGLPVGDSKEPPLVGSRLKKLTASAPADRLSQGPIFCATVL